MISNQINEGQQPHSIQIQQGNAAQGDIDYLPSKYSKAFNNYSRTQIKTIMPFIASISRTCSLSSLYPICKVLKAISKIYMLNEIEVIFLAYLIKQTNWDIRDKTIFHNAENVQDIIYYSIDNLDYKRIILYLMVTAFTVKFYLNENTSQILQEATKRCPNFKQIFQSWNKKHSSIITKINPRTLNIVYKKLYSASKQDLPDFNMMVDAIIQISPAYNPERQKQNHEMKKKVQRKQVDVILKKQQQVGIKLEKSGVLSAPVALFSSSGLLNMMSLHHQNQPNNQNNQGLSGMFSLGKSERVRQDYLGILGSSVVGGISGPNLDVNQQDDCGQLVVGLHDGQSQQNIVFQDKNSINNSGVGFQYINPNNQNNSILLLNSNQDSPYYTSIINLTRRSSINGKQKFGTSEVFLNGDAAQDNTTVNLNRPQRRQASIVNLDISIKKEDQSE